MNNHMCYIERAIFISDFEYYISDNCEVLIPYADSHQRWRFVDDRRMRRATPDQIPTCAV